MNDHSIILITGASSGIGCACAEHLQQRGYRVYGTSRSPQSSSNPSFELIQMDVDSENSVQQAFRLVMEREGRIDVVVNNAGMGFAGAIEETSEEEARAQMETNFFGALRVCRVVLPIMRAQCAGLIVNISSIGGVIGIPFQGLYSASKFAIEGMTETLRMEARPFGIRVVLIEPGDFRTGFTAHRRRTRQSTESTVYAEKLGKALAVMEADEQGGPSPDRIGRLIERIIKMPNPRLRWVIGPLPEIVALALKPFLPPALFEWALSKYYRL
jgi:NAD(P)-dependent dehydrogenase (short-subunit alcohol dehydrogenase family)